MSTRNILIGLPVFILLILAQSVLWVPTQKRQAHGNPKRLVQYLEGSNADPVILNPILHADGASSDICDLVFEGLLDYDENLQYRGRLAESWQILEEAYITIDETQTFPDGTPVTAQGLLSRIQEAEPQDSTKILEKIKKMEILEPTVEARKPPVEFYDLKLKEIKVRLPSRLKLTLTRVEQDLQLPLEQILGKSYFEKVNTEHLMELKEKIPADRLQNLAREIAPRLEHNPVILFQLRKNVTFHDHQPFTAEDVRFTFEAIMDERHLSPRVSDYEPIKEVKVLAPLQVKVIYKRLYSPAINSWFMGILPKHLLDKEALSKEAKALGKNPAEFTLRDSRFNQNPIGTGPFQFVQWKRDQFLELKRNDQYWEGAPNLESYVYRIIPENLGKEMEFYAGTLDGYLAQPHQIDRLKDNPDYQSFSALSNGYSFIGYNLRREIFKDVRVRTALAMAIPVQDLIQYIFYGHAEQTTGPFLKQTPYYDPTIAPIAYDPQKAQELLRESGWEKDANGKLVQKETGNPFRFTLLTNQGVDLRKGIMIVAQEAWSKLGIEMTIQEVEWSVFIQKNVNQLNFDAIVLGWQMGYDPDLYQVWHSSQANPEQLNFVGYQNPKADELIVRIRREYDPKKQIQYCHQLHRIIANDQPYTFLVAGRGTALLDRNIVRRIHTPEGEIFAKIVPTVTGNYRFHFNQWIKVLQ